MSFRSCLVRWILALSLSVSCLGLAPAQPAIAVPAMQNPADEAALRDLATIFFKTWSAKDLEGFLSLWSAKSPELEAQKKSTSEIFASSEKIEISNLLVQRVKIEGDQANLVVKLEAAVIERKTGKPQNGSGKMLRTLHCVKEASGWKVWQEAATVDDFAASLAAAANNQQRADLLEQEKELKTVELQRALLRQGGKLNQQRKFDQGIELVQFALTLSESLGDKTGAALALRNIGFTYGLQENYRKAVEYFEKALALQAALSKPSQAELLRNVSVMHYYLGNYPAALDYAHKALAIFTELQNEGEMAGIMINMAVIYRGQSDYTQALEYYQRSLRLLQNTGDQEETARLYNNMAVIYSMRGDHIKALEGFQKALKLKESLPQRSDSDIADTLYNIGNVHLEQGNAELALDFYQRALVLHGKEGKKQDLGVGYNRMGRAYDKLGNYQVALEYYRKALVQFEALENKAALATNLLSMGSLYLQQQNYGEALGYLQKSLNIYESLGDNHGIAGALINLGSLCYQQGNYAQGLTLVERATAIAEKTGSLDQTAELYYLKGDLHFALGQEALCRQAYEKSIAAIEMLRSQTAGGEQDRQRLLAGNLTPWHGLIRLLVKQQNYQEALSYAEQSRARVLLDVLQNGRVDFRKAMTPEEQEKERKLKAEVTSLNTQLLRLRQKENEQPMIQDCTERLGKARLALEAFQTSLYASHSELRTQRGEAPTIRPEELSSLLPEAKRAVLEYAVTEEAIYLFVITKNEHKPEAEVQTFTLPVKSSELVKQIERFRAQLAARNLGFREQSKKLYDLLVKPAEAQLRGKTNLVIAPDGKLWELPFQALLSGTNRFLIEDAAIAYAPSLTVLREMARHKQQLPGAGSSTLLALGNPMIGKETVERATQSLRDAKLTPLPEAEQEVKALGRLYGAPRSKVYIGQDAREDRVKTEAGNANILHFATHGVLNNVSPMYSYLLLAQGDKNEDGLLEAWELMQMDLKADLAVLSACETARGRYGAGEGMIGLTWALFVAGVPSTVVSQWKVESASTRDLMLNFHQQLRAPSATKTPMAKAEALRQAALKVMKNPETNHPFYWAGFVLVGDGR